MTVQVGWIGKERPVDSIIPVLQAAETRDQLESTQVVRNHRGEAFLALAYLAPLSIKHSYDFVGSASTVVNWKESRLSSNPVSTITMATMTRADLDDPKHNEIPATTVRHSGDYTLITGTTGSATEFANLMGIPEHKGDTEDIADWVISRGLDALRTSLDAMIRIPCSMNMVFTLIGHHWNHVEVHLMRSALKPGWNPRPYLHYNNSESGLVYTSLAEEGANLVDVNQFIPVPGKSVIPLIIH